jgi:hypothetical protein
VRSTRPQPSGSVGGVGQRLQPLARLAALHGAREVGAGRARRQQGGRALQHRAVGERRGLARLGPVADLDDARLAGLGLGAAQPAGLSAGQPHEGAAHRGREAVDDGQMQRFRMRGGVGLGRVERQILQPPVDQQRRRGPPGQRVERDDAPAPHAASPASVTG